MAKRTQKGAGSRKGGKRKHGRMKDWCEAYFRRGQRLKNKKAKLRKHLIHHTNDKVAEVALSKKQ